MSATEHVRRMARAYLAGAEDGTVGVAFVDVSRPEGFFDCYYQGFSVALGRCACCYPWYMHEDQDTCRLCGFSRKS